MINEIQQNIGNWIPNWQERQKIDQNPQPPQGDPAATQVAMLLFPLPKMEVEQLEEPIAAPKADAKMLGGWRSTEGDSPWSTNMANQEKASNKKIRTLGREEILHQLMAYPSHDLSHDL